MLQDHEFGEGIRTILKLELTRLRLKPQGSSPHSEPHGLRRQLLSSMLPFSERVQLPSLTCPLPGGLRTRHPQPFRTRLRVGCMLWVGEHPLCVWMFVQTRQIDILALEGKAVSSAFPVGGGGHGKSKTILPEGGANMQR